jgi:2-polyprenyl-3-methyl-5-hydroxy-6-metoxy-1,4-benzoquinol methylase
MKHLTTSDFWDRGYARAANVAPLDLADYRRYGERRLIEVLEELELDGKRVLEVGAGNSAVLTLLARRHAGRARFAGLDYAPAGCRLLEERARNEGVEVAVYQRDLFNPGPELLSAFDVVFSLGVVEHFTDLTAALAAKRALTAPGGRVFTLIPNMRGILGALTRRYNREIYERHVPHDMASLLRGHAEAGLKVERAYHLCSNNFGVLSICFQGPEARGFGTYKWLSRLTKAVWYTESRVGELPAHPLVSPYLVVVSTTATDAR